MGRRSIKDFVAGLRQQIADERATLDAMKRDRDSVIANLDKAVETQAAKVAALEGVVESMTTPAKKVAVPPD